MHRNLAHLCSRLLIFKMACPQLLQIAVKTHTVHRVLAHLCSQMLILGLKSKFDRQNTIYSHCRHSRTFGGVPGSAPTVRKHRKYEGNAHLAHLCSQMLILPIKASLTVKTQYFGTCENTVNTQGNCKCVPSPVAPLQPFAHSQNGLSSTPVNSSQNAKCVP